MKMASSCRGRRRKKPCYSRMSLDISVNVWFPYPGLCILLIYCLHPLDYCHSAQDGLQDINDNLTDVQNYLSSTMPDMGQSGQIQDGDLEGQIQNGSTTSKSGINKPKKLLGDDSRANDVLHKLGLDSPVTKDTSSTPTSVPTAGTTSTPATSTSLRPTTTTRRHIYVRGHLLNPQPPGRKTFPPRDTPNGLYRDPHSARLSRVHNHQDTDQDQGSRQKRKHNTKKERFYNYKLLYDTLKSGGDAKHKRTEFYAWIFGSTMLGLGGITMVTFFTVFCICGNRARMKKRTAHARRPSDKAGEYQRVESVSSIVDHGGDPLETIYEEPTDSVTII